jgi:hypothetical protein
MPPAFLFVFCFWDRVVITFPKQASIM